jgi:hypothetical protein
MTATHPDPLASERLLGKALAKGRPMRRRRTVLRRAAVLGFVGALAAGGAAGAAVATSGRPQRPVASHQPRIGYTQLFPASVRASAAVAGDPPANADDNDLDTFWGVGAAHHQLPGVGQSLTMQFTQSEAVAAVAIFDGDQQTPADFASTFRPAEVELVFSSGTPVVFDLTPAPTLQSARFAPRRTYFVKIVVLSVYLPSHGAASDPLRRICAVSDVFAYVQG